MGEKNDICGLSVAEFDKLVYNLGIIWHAVDEEDWERLGIGLFKQGLDEIKKAGTIMTKAACPCPPHGLFDPDEVAVFLSGAIASKNKGKALTHLCQLMWALLDQMQTPKEEHKETLPAWDLSGKGSEQTGHLKL